MRRAHVIQDGHLLRRRRWRHRVVALAIAISGRRPALPPRMATPVALNFVVRQPPARSVRYEGLMAPKRYVIEVRLATRFA